MSAYLMNSQTIGLLAHFAVESKAVNYGICYNLDVDTTEKVVKALVRANLLSLAVRYPDTTDPAIEFSGLSVDDYIAECIEHSKRIWSVPAIEVLSSCACFNYQSCEYDDWYSSMAYKIISVIRDAAITRLPDYDNAKWGYSTENPPKILTNMSDLKGRKPVAGEVISLFS